MSLDHFFRIGQTIDLGHHTFSAEEIKIFAQEFDPQVFHTDEEAAKKSLLGGLCASGWHTCSMWMRYNYAARKDATAPEWHGEGPRPEFGPSPGFKNLRWIKPIYAGKTINFKRTALSHRALASKPGWRMLTIKAEAFDQDGTLVLEMENAVLVKI